MGCRMATLLLSLPAVCQTASMFRGNLQHSGIYASGPVEQFRKIKWKFQTGGRVICPPAVADGMVYLGSTDNPAPKNESSPPQSG
jgi:eukaryotic-like serine/threonine-protein kinase